MSSAALTLAPEAKAKVEAAIKVARELKLRRSDEPLKYYRPLPHGAAFHASTAKERWLVAGNGAGKTEIGAAEVAMLVTDKASWWDGPPGEVWCGAVGLADSVAVQRPAVARYVPERLIKSWPHRDDGGAESVLTLTNGWVVRFKASNQLRERWQGGNVALVWFDEEPDPDVFDEAYARTRIGGRVILTFTPLNGLRWDEGHRRVYQPWCEYRRQHPEAKHGEVAPGLHVFTASVTDNPHVKPAEVEAMRRLWSHRPLMLRARENGEWLNLSSESVVAMDKIKSHAFTFDSPPQGGWSQLRAWCDPSFSKNETSDRWAIGLAAKDAHGKVYLLAMDYGRLDPDERVLRAVTFLASYDYPTCYVQPTNGDREYMARVNTALMAAGASACVTEWPRLVGKTERAHSFSVAASNGQVYIHDGDGLEEFRREASAFPHGKHDDVFDAGMGAAMSLVTEATSDAPWDVTAAGRITSTRHRGQRDDGAPVFDDDDETDNDLRMTDFGPD